MLFEHDVGVDEGLLEQAPLVGKVVQHGRHLLRDLHLVLVHDGELLLQGGELGLDLLLVTIELLPQGQTVAQLI